MSCDIYRQVILDRDWTERTLAQAADVNAHLRSCAACREALSGYDALRMNLQTDPDQPEIDLPPGFDPAALLVRYPRRHALGPLALAACLAVAAGGWAMYMYSVWSTSSAGAPGRIVATDPHPSPTGGDGMAGDSGDSGGRSIALTADDVQQQVSMFANVAEVFEGRTQWVASGDHASDLGIAQTPIGSNSRVLLLRLVMSRGDRIVSDANLVIVPGESAKLTVPFENGHNLRYRVSTSRQEPRTLSLWAELQRSDGGADESLAALGTTLRPLGNQVLPAGRMVTSSGGYELDVAFSEAQLPRQP